MDIPDIRRVIHYGAPSDTEEYLQETGRAGRDGKRSEAIILYHRYALSGHVSAEIKDYMKTKKCRRQVLLAIFNETYDSKLLHCCDNCDASYSCCSCPLKECSHSEQLCYCVKFCFAYGFAKPSATSEATHVSCRSRIVGESYSKCVTEIKNLRSNLKTVPSNVCNIYPELVENIMKNHTSIGSAKDILEMGAFSLADAQKILGVLNNYSNTLQPTSVTDSFEESSHSSSESSD